MMNTLCRYALCCLALTVLGCDAGAREVQVKEAGKEVVLTGATYFKSICGGCAASLYFVDESTGKVQALQCGCRDQCSVSGSWKTPAKSVVKALQFERGRPLALTVSNQEDGRTFNFPPCIQ